MTTLNLGYLATFRLVHQRGSFSAAADVLGLSQPAVSLQIRQLEQFLQTRLVERTGRGIKATAAGETLLAHGERIQQVVDDAIRAVNAFSHDVSGTITLGTGATACIPALVQSGFPCDRFCFEGFLPQKKGRNKRLQELASEERTMVFYESPYRVVKCLEQFVETFGAERPVSVSRELTKKFEQTVRGTAGEVLEHFRRTEPRGEFVLVVAGRPKAGKARRDESENEEYDER